MLVVALNASHSILLNRGKKEESSDFNYFSAVFLAQVLFFIDSFLFRVIVYVCDKQVLKRN